MSISGIINIDKPENWTSQDVCSKLRHKLHIRRVGHTGTLDPMATGVLPVCLGKATRIIEYYDADLKTYQAELQLGLITDTLDRTGTVLERNDPSALTREDILSAFGSQQGWVEQIPPRYSALKVGGRRLYDYARAGQEVEIRSRKIYIDSLTVEEIDLPAGRVRFTVRCSKGTYIRTICDEIGKHLGCGAVMTELVRTGSGYFELPQAYSLETFLEMSDSEILSAILPMDRTLTHLGTVTLKSLQSVPFYQNGRAIDDIYVRDRTEVILPPFIAEDSPVRNRYRVYDPEGQFLGVSRYDAEKKQFLADKIIMI